MSVEPAEDWSICRPVRVLQRALPEAMASAVGAIVVAADGDALVIAVAAPCELGLAVALARAARRPVRLVASGPQEIALALARCRGVGDPTVIYPQRMSHLITDLGLNDALDDESRALLTSAAQGASDAAWRLSARLPEGRALARGLNGWDLELGGLIEGLPHLAGGAPPIEKALRLLLPPRLRSIHGTPEFVPWRVERGALLLVCATVPSDDAVAMIADWTGLRVRCVLCDLTPPSDSRNQGAPRPHLVARDICDRDSDATPRDGASVERGGVPARAVTAVALARLRRPHRLARGDRYSTGRHVEALARQTGVSPEVAAGRLVLTTPTPRLSHLPRPTPQALATLPARLARSLGVLPLNRGRHFIEIAMAADAANQEDLVATVAHVTGLSVRVRAAVPSTLQAALTRAYDAPTIGTALVESPTPVADQLPVVTENDRSGNELARCESLAVRHGLPYIRLEHYAPRPDVADCLPLDRLHELRAVPIHREGQVLWVALDMPSAATLRELAGLTRFVIRPLLATPTAITHHLAALEVAAHPENQLARHDHPVITYLKAQRLITRTQLLHVLADPSCPLDQALDEAAILTYQQFATVAAQLSGLPLEGLDLQQRREEIVDALGRPTHRLIWDDPVVPETASLLAPAVVESSGLLPLRRAAGRSVWPMDGIEEGTLLLAVSDPFALENAAILDSLVGERPQLVVSPRPAILSALARAQGQTRLGERLLAAGIITSEELARALQLHRNSGVRIGQALLSLDVVSQRQLAHFIGKQRGLAVVALDDMRPDIEVTRLLPEEAERRLGALPLYDAGDTLVVATPDPLNQAMIDEIAARTRRELTFVVCTEADLEALLETLYRDDDLQRSTSELVMRTPEESASRVLSHRQGRVLIVTGIVALALLWRMPAAVGIGATALCTMFYLVFSLYRCYLIYRALSHDLEISISDEEVAAVDEARLPIYTILVPLYREAAVLPILLRGLARLDYPASKLDVKLLLEEDDTETLAAVAATALPSYVQPVVVPAAPPRGKPKACNYGLIRARGDYVVIYDAEDVPDPDQLKKVVLAFRRAPSDVACLQAKLNYYNANQNLLTRWFTTEYSMWFDLFLPGLDASGVPIPLGGTSNHFPTARLREMGAWDPYNVTEDADLGIRLFRHGWKTAVVDSTTYEEANSEVYNWIRQRSRWVKGYVQTFLVHMRHPIQLWRTIGTKAFFSFLMVVGGTFVSFLLNPIFWCLTALWYLSHAEFIRAIYPGPVFYVSL